MPPNVRFSHNYMNIQNFLICWLDFANALRDKKNSVYNRRFAIPLRRSMVSLNIHSSNKRYIICAYKKNSKGWINKLSAPIGGTLKLSAFLGNYDRPNNREVSLPIRILFGLCLAAKHLLRSYYWFSLEILFGLIERKGISLY